MSRTLSTLLLAAMFVAPGIRHVMAAEVYIVHGIPGADLGLDPTLPVDIAVDGGCAVTAFTYQSVSAATTLSTGEHTIEVRLSDGTCTGTLAVTARIDLSVNETAVLVAHLDENGAARLSKFTVDTSAIDPGMARVMVVHAAAAPVVDLKLRNENKAKEKRSITDLRSGNFSAALSVSADPWQIKIKAAESGDNVATLEGVDVAGNAVLVAVGSLANATFTVIPVAIVATP